MLVYGPYDRDTIWIVDRFFDRKMDRGLIQPWFIFDRGARAAVQFKYALFSQFWQLGLIFRAVPERPRSHFPVGPDRMAQNRYEWTEVGPVRRIANINRKLVADIERSELIGVCG